MTKSKLVSLSMKNAKLRWVKKLETTKLVRDIEQRAKANPQQLDFFVYREGKNDSFAIDSLLISYRYEEMDRIEREEELKKQVKGKAKKYVRVYNNLTKAQKTMRRNQAISAMLHTKTWSNRLAEKFEIEKQDVEVRYTEEQLLYLALNFEFEQDFRMFVLEKGREAFKVEQEKVEAYYKKVNPKLVDETNFLRKLLKAGKEKEALKYKIPRLVAEQKLWFKDQDGLSEFERLHQEIENLKEKSKTGEVTEYFYKQEKAKIRKKIKRDREEREILFRNLFWDEESNKNATFIKAIGYQRAQNKDNSLPYLRVTSLAQGKYLINEYRKWFNNKYEEEIKLDQELNKKETKQQYDTDKAALKRAKKKKRDEEIMELHAQGLNNTQISKQTGVARKTVADIINRILSAPPLDEMSETDKEKFERELEEERQAIERVREKELEKLNRERKKEVQELLDKEVLKHHERGWTPTMIARFVHLSAKQIKKRLENLGKTPRFDMKLATEQEIEEHFKNRKLERPDRKLEL